MTLRILPLAYLTMQMLTLRHRRLMMTKTELMQAIYRLTHGTGVYYQIIDEDSDGDTEMTVYFNELSDTPIDTTSSIGG